MANVSNVLEVVAEPVIQEILGFALVVLMGSNLSTMNVSDAHLDVPLASMATVQLASLVII